jgi:hypothetical protein
MFARGGRSRERAINRPGPSLSQRPLACRHAHPTATTAETNAAVNPDRWQWPDRRQDTSLEHSPSDDHVTMQCISPRYRCYRLQPLAQCAEASGCAEPFRYRSRMSRTAEARSFGQREGVPNSVVLQNVTRECNCLRPIPLCQQPGAQTGRARIFFRLTVAPIARTCEQAWTSMKRREIETGEPVALGARLVGACAQTIFRVRPDPRCRSGPSPPSLWGRRAG